MNPDINLQEVMEVIVSKKRLINEDTPSIDVIDLDFFDARMWQLKEAFPEAFFNHCFAIKANPIRGVLKAVRDTGFMGAETASIAEVMLAHELGFPSDKIVYDSPVKSKVDLSRALDLNIVINLDNEMEIKLVDDLLQQKDDNLNRVIGLRINPTFDENLFINEPQTTAAFFPNTGLRESKFGLALVPGQTKDKILGLYKKYSWLNAVHFHVGSQGNPMKLFVQSAMVVMDFVKELESVCHRKIHTIDIGGGLSTDFDEAPEPEEFSYKKYRQELELFCPDLFSGRYQVVTEMGGSLVQKAGKTLMRVETVKNWVPDVRPILLTHVGCNQFLFEVYLPGCYGHRFDIVCPKTGHVKREGRKTTYDIAGCICFQGDYLQKNVDLVQVQAGDVLLMHDTGAYAMSMYSRFISHSPSPVYGIRRSEQDKFVFTCLKDRETIQQTLEFWGPTVQKVI